MINSLEPLKLMAWALINQINLIGKNEIFSYICKIVPTISF